MKQLLILLGMLARIAGILSFQNSRPSVSEKHRGTDSLASERERFTNEILATIKGKESEMAGTRFKKIPTFGTTKRIKANHFLAVLNYCVSALGVSCYHRHK